MKKQASSLANKPLFFTVLIALEANFPPPKVQYIFLKHKVGQHNFEQGFRRL
jgi:hypothetical protein